MESQADWRVLREWCVAELGEHVGAQLAALARSALDLSPATDGDGTGRWTFGGPALLEPGTPWPEFDGLPLSLLAVLDVDAFADWLGDQLPRRTGLLNVFVLDPELDYDAYRHLDADDPRWLRVVPADPATAVAVPAPAPARSYEPTPIHVEPVLTLPDPWEDVVGEIDLGPDGEDKPPGLVVEETCREWNEDLGDMVFGWPQWELGPVPTWRDDHALLLKISDSFPSCPWPTIYVTIPVESLRRGDLGQAMVSPETY